MAVEPRPLISGDLLLQRLRRFAEGAEERARSKGIREEDVPRLVDEIRRENEACGD